jgi:pimeloyl-ACP methyl ester carboxylesterase
MYGPPAYYHSDEEAMAEQDSSEPIHFERVLDSKVLGSRVLVSSQSDVETAIIFVHGFSGDPVDTWKDFHGSMDSASHRGWWKNADVYFFNYLDVTSPIDDSADLLSEFVDGIYPVPSGYGYVNASRKYCQLILVGHSEGAIVLRSYLVELGKELMRTANKSAVLDARLVLFAPAMFGFVPTRWLGAFAALSGIRQIIDLFVAYSPAATEMRTGIVLKQIQDDTERLYEAFPQTRAFTAYVAFGEHESVVVKARYFQDIKHSAVAGRDHQTICKPSLLYQWPLKFVSGNKV